VSILAHFDWRSGQFSGFIPSEDPQAWGYLPLTTPDSVYEVDTTASLQPFHLHLIGNAGDPKIPHALSNVVRVHYDLLYDRFYSVVHSMDLILPAFATLECQRHSAFYEDYCLILSSEQIMRSKQPSPWQSQLSVMCIRLHAFCVH
jgi:hypothetical protein